MKLYIKPCHRYPLHELEITDWLAKEKGYDTQATGPINILYEMKDAYEIEIEGRPRVLPRSQCEIVERTGPKK